METYGEYITRPSGDRCLVCDNGLSLTFTDYNNEATCNFCGVNYYISRFRVAQNAIHSGVQPGDIYPWKLTPESHQMCQLYRDFWMCHETRIPVGTYFLRGRICPTRSEYISFAKWLLSIRGKGHGIEHLWNWEALENLAQEEETP